MEAAIVEAIVKLGIDVGVPLLVRELEKLGGHDAVLAAHDALLARFRAQTDEALRAKHAERDARGDEVTRELPLPPKDPA